MHPGGSAILKGCGQDLSQFNSAHPGGQFDSANVKSILDAYKIGTM